MEDPITGDDAVRSAVEEDEAEAVASGLGTAFLQPPDVKLRHDVARPSMLVTSLNACTHKPSAHQNGIDEVRQLSE